MIKPSILALAVGLALTTTAAWAADTTESQRMQNCVTTERAKISNPDEAVITQTCKSRVQTQESTTSKDGSTTTTSTTKDAAKTTQQTVPTDDKPQPNMPPK